MAKNPLSPLSQSRCHLLNWQGHSFSLAVFHSRRFFEVTPA